MKDAYRVELAPFRRREEEIAGIRLTIRDSRGKSIGESERNWRAETSPIDLPEVEAICEAFQKMYTEAVAKATGGATWSRTPAARAGRAGRRRKA